eukprot:2455364-Prorocentrum_lima.AAC.1
MCVPLPPHLLLAEKITSCASTCMHDNCRCADQHVEPIKQNLLDGGVPRWQAVAAGTAAPRGDD